MIEKMLTEAAAVMDSDTKPEGSDSWQKPKQAQKQSPPKNQKQKVILRKAQK